MQLTKYQQEIFQMKTYKDYIVEANMNGLNYMVKLTQNSRPQVLSGTPLSVENVINHSSKVVRQSGSIHDYNNLFKNIIFKNCSDSPKDMLNALNKWSEYPDPVLLGKTWKFVRETKDFQIDRKDFDKKFNKKVKVVSLSHVSNVT